MAIGNGIFPAGTTGGSQLVTQIETVLATHPSWSFIEGTTVGTEFHRVWKCTGSGANANDFGQDFYVSFGRGSSGTQSSMTMRAFEAYNLTLHQPIRPCAGKNTTVATAINANYSYGDETNGVLFTNLDVASMSVNAGNGANVTWYCIVTKNGVWVKAFVSSVDCAYAGLFDSKLDGVSPHRAEPFPLMVVGHSVAAQQPGTQSVGVSRHPGRVGSGVSNFAHHLTEFSPVYGTQSGVDLHQGESSAPRIAVIGNIDPGVHDIYGGLRGLMKDARVTGMGTTGAVSDTIVIDGETYWYFRLGGVLTNRMAWARRDSA